MNRFSTLVVLAAVLVSFGGRAHAGMIIATADLLGTSQVPPTNSPATGFATIQVDTVAQTIHYDESYKNLEANAIASHIHFGGPIVNGPIILPFTPAPTGTSGEIMGTLTAADLINQTASGISTFQDIVTALEAGNLYVNLHGGNPVSVHLFGGNPVSVHLFGQE